MKTFDPRYYQIAILVSGFVYGQWVLDFALTLLMAVAIFMSTQITQYIFSKIYRLPAFDPKSALISSLSLCLLLRTNSLWLAVFAAVLASNSKFIIRWRGKHILTPLILLWLPCY